MALPKRFAKMLTANSNFSYQQRKINRFFSVLPEKKAALVKMKVNLKKKNIFRVANPNWKKSPRSLVLSLKVPSKISAEIPKKYSLKFLSKRQNVPLNINILFDNKLF
jgi:hypothetical protein